MALDGGPFEQFGTAGAEGVNQKVFVMVGETPSEACSIGQKPVKSSRPSIKMSFTTNKI